MKVAFYSGAALALSFLAGGLIWLHDPLDATLAFAASVFAQARAINTIFRQATDECVRSARHYSALAQEARHARS